MGGSWGGIPSDRVVAVGASLDTGLVQIGSGYLVTEGRVLTAKHCTADKRTGRPARSIRVSRLSDGAEAPARLLAAASGSDVAVLAVGESPTWRRSAAFDSPRFGRVDRSRSGELHDCEAVGFPLWQLDARDQGRNAAELHGTIRMTEDAESGFLLMRDPLLGDVGVPSKVTAEDQNAESPWGGLSGALVFHQGIALGVVIEHHPRQGHSAITILPVERFAAGGASGDPGRAAVAAALGLPSADKLPVAGRVPLAGLVDVLVQGWLPRVAELDPYTLGATPSEYGNAKTHGQRDKYVTRTNDEVLAAELRPGRLVVLVGPSKVGKTRTAFEVLRRHDDWSGALLAVPVSRSLDQLAGHPGLKGSSPLVIWLDDLPRFLPPTGQLSRATISHLVDRPGPVVLLATLRSEQRERLRGTEGELIPEVRMVLDHASSIELRSTREDPDEQTRATAIYPQVGTRPEGLAEVLAGAPELLRRYRNSAAADPPLHILVQTCVDWARSGHARPIPEPKLLALARATLEEIRPDLDLRGSAMDEALRRARQPVAAGGQVALLRTRTLRGRSRGYEAFDYLIAADDGQGGERPRLVANPTWRRFLDRAKREGAFSGLDAARRAMDLYSRYRQTGDLGSLNESIDMFRFALSAKHHGPALRAAILSNLGNALRARSEQTGSLSDVDAAIDACRSSVGVTSHDDPEYAGRLSNLGNALRTRFQITGNPADIDEAVTTERDALAATPHARPDRAKTLANLASALTVRFLGSGDQANIADIDGAIDAARAAVAATSPDGHDRAGFLRALIDAVSARLKLTADLADRDLAIELHGEILQDPAFSMLPASLRVHVLRNAGANFLRRYRLTDDPADLQHALDPLQEGIELAAPASEDLGSCLFNLARALYSQYEHSGGRSRLEAAIAAYERIGREVPDNVVLDLPSVLMFQGHALHSKALSFDPDALDPAIEAYRRALDLTPEGSPEYPERLSGLEIALRERFHQN